MQDFVFYKIERKENRSVNLDSVYNLGKNLFKLSLRNLLQKYFAKVCFGAVAIPSRKLLDGPMGRNTISA